MTFINQGYARAAHDETAHFQRIFMRPELTAPFKAQLLAQRASLIDQLANLRGGMVSRAEASADHFGQAEDSTAQVNSARELEFALDARETAELVMGEAALGRIEVGTYGQCISCGVEIPVARLQAAPEAARCIACQEQEGKEES